MVLNEDPDKDILMMCYFAYPSAGVPSCTSGFATSSASAATTQTSTSLTVASTSGSVKLS